MLQNKRLFILLLLIVVAAATTGGILLATKNSTIQTSNTIPSSRNLSSLPLQASDISEYTMVIQNLPTNISYTETRNLEESMAYIINPAKKYSSYTATYREGSASTADDGRATFLVDVDSVKETFIIYDKQDIACAPQALQKQAEWHCSIQDGEV